MVKSLVRYFRVGNLLHIIAVFALITAILSTLNLVYFGHSFSTHQIILWVAISVIFGNMFLLAELDGFSRYQNYKQVKDQVFLYGFQYRLLKPLTRSSCQREAAILACLELGLNLEVRNYFYDKGYRWYHIIPDFVFEYPLFFFSSFFWRTTFFTPFYKSKISYDDVDISKIDLISKGLNFEPVY